MRSCHLGRSIIPVLCVLALPSALAGQKPDALSAAAAALGTSGLSSITFTATGRAFMFGQQPGAAEPWPAVLVKSYEVTIDYQHGGMRIEQIHTSATNTPRGGSTAIDGERREVLYARDGLAWSETAGQDAVRTATPQPAAAAERAVWTWAAAPQGLIKAAGTAPVRTTSSGAEFSFTLGGRYRVVATIDRANHLTAARTQIPDDVLGDMPVEVTYSDYGLFGSMAFPSRIVVREGGHPTLDLAVTGVKANVVADVTVPDNVRTTAGAPTVQSQKLAEGIYWILGEVDNSLVADMGDHVVVLEAPLNEATSVAAIAEIRKLVPDKPIRYVVNTHLHFDHAGGLRTFVNEGAVVVTHQDNIAYLDKAWRSKRTIVPDRLSRSGRKWTFRGVTDRLVLRGTNQRTIELHHLPGNPHDAQMLVAWLPLEELLFQADVLGLPASLLNFSDTIERLNIRPKQILGVHGRRPLAMNVVDTAVRNQRAKQK